MIVLGLVDIADPVLTLTVVIVLLFVLWVLQRHTRALLVLRHQLQSLERGQQQLDEELEILGRSREMPALSESGASRAVHMGAHVPPQSGTHEAPQPSGEQTAISGPHAAIRRTKGTPRSGTHKVPATNARVSESSDLLDDALAELD